MSYAGMSEAVSAYSSLVFSLSLKLSHSLFIGSRLSTIQAIATSFSKLNDNGKYESKETLDMPFCSVPVKLVRSPVR